MSGLKCSKEEALEILDYDKRVERGEHTEYDLSPEQEKAARKFARTGTRKMPMIPNLKQPKEQKPDLTKEGLISALYNFLLNYDSVQDVELKNKSREVSFSLGGESFGLTLIRHTKKKKGG